MWYGGWRVWVDGCTVVWVEGVVWWVDGCAIGGGVWCGWRDGTRGLCTTLHWTFTFLSPVPDNDTLVFINFRSDRMRQIVEALGIKPQFPTEGCVPQNLVRCVALCLPHPLNDLICVPTECFHHDRIQQGLPFPNIVSCEDTHQHGCRMAVVERIAAVPLRRWEGEEGGGGGGEENKGRKRMVVVSSI